MSLDLSQFTTTDSGIYVPRPLSRVNTIPWDDLQALDPPDVYQNVNQDLQATLANMVGQTLTGPKLIRSNFAGAVRSDANINPTSIVTTGCGAGGTVITVDDASQFAESAQCFVTNGYSNPTIYGFISGITLINFDTRQITLQVPAPNAVLVGDIVQSMPITFVIPQSGFWNGLFGHLGDTTNNLWRIGSIFQAPGSVDVSVSFAANQTPVVTDLEIYMQAQPGVVFDSIIEITDPNGVEWYEWIANSPSVQPQLTVKSQQFSVNMAAAGINHVVPAVSGQTVTLLGINAVVSAAGAFAGNWQDTAGTAFFSDTLQSGNPRTFDMKGFALASGLGVDFNVTAAGASFYIGNVLYTQGSVTARPSVSSVVFHGHKIQCQKGGTVHAKFFTPIPSGVQVTVQIGGYYFVS